MQFRTTRQHLAHAIQLLATADGSMVNRLRAAHDEALCHIERNPGLPQHLRPAFDALMTALDDLFKQSTVDEEQARRLATEVVMLYQRVIKR